MVFDVLRGPPRPLRDDNDLFLTNIGNGVDRHDGREVAADGSYWACAQ